MPWSQIDLILVGIAVLLYTLWSLGMLVFIFAPQGRRGFLVWVGINGVLLSVPLVVEPVVRLLLEVF